ncbi:hypothetical protein J4457_02165 [Candidatus Woesearchaeota archaeon]|nr:hypothetical protein [Candidatus Woesearchaeota archaeon]
MRVGANFGKTKKSRILELMEAVPREAKVEVSHFSKDLNTQLCKTGENTI